MVSRIDVFINNGPVGILCSYTPTAQNIINQTPFRFTDIDINHFDDVVYVSDPQWQSFETTRIWDLVGIYGTDGTVDHVVGAGEDVLNNLFVDYTAELASKYDVQWGMRIID